MICKVWIQIWLKCSLKLYISPTNLFIKLSTFFTSFIKTSAEKHIFHRKNCHYLSWKFQGKCSQRWDKFSNVFPYFPMTNSNINYLKLLLLAHMLAHRYIQKYILYLFFFSEKKRKMTYMPWNLYFPSLDFLFGCLGRQDKTYIEMGVSYNLIMRYIIPRIWAWKFHSIVENLIWYFFHRCFSFSIEKEKKTRSRESFTSRRWDLVGNCISISFVFFANDSAKWWTFFCGELFLSFRAISFRRIFFHFS